MTQFFLDLDAVCLATSLSTGGIQELVRKGDFPKARALSPRRVAWLAREVEEWCENRPLSTCPPPPNAGRRKGS